MYRKIRNLLLLVLGGLALVVFSPARAQTINWGNATSVDDINFDSSGGLLDATYTYVLGVFDAGFDPVLESTADWYSNWTTLSTATYNEGASYFSDSWLVTDNTYVGRQAYIWIYNKTEPLDSTTEWALITDADGLGVGDGADDDWVIPTLETDDGDGCCGKGGTFEWRIQNATTGVFGGLNDTQGAGEYSDTPTPFEVQTHSFPPLVPEPGIFALFACAGLLGLRRGVRRR